MVTAYRFAGDKIFWHIHQNFIHVIRITDIEIILYYKVIAHIILQIIIEQSYLLFQMK